jgi:hypothetical protein
MSRVSDDELADTLDELAGLLDRLEGELPADRRPRDDRPRRDRRRRGRDREELPRPPRPGEFIRFTEQYTIPTLISLLEATVAVLELLRAVLRLTGGRGLPDPRPGRSRDPIGETGRRAIEGLDDVLTDLNDALSGQPTDPEARDLLTEARDLRSEIERLIEDGRRDGRSRSARDRDRDGRGDRGTDDRSTGGVSIAVDDGEAATEGSTTGTDTDTDTNDTDDADDEGATVDVEAELDALKRARDEDN